MNEDSQLHEQNPAPAPQSDPAPQVGIVGVDGTPTTPEGQPVGAAATTPAPAQPGTAAAPVDPQAEAAAQLVAIYKALPGVVPALIGGTTVAEVQQSLEAAKAQYADIRAQLLQEQGVAVPAAHAGAGGRPVPTDPFEMIKQGVGGLK